MKFTEFLTTVSNNQELLSAYGKSQRYLNRARFPQISISGGADSDILLDMVTLAADKSNMQFIFFDTGIEYEATKRHLDYLEQKYGIVIERHRAKTPVPLACRRYGVPFISKYVSEMIQRLQRHGFKWEDKPFAELITEYPNCKVALKWWSNEHGEKSKFNINYHKLLKEFLIENPPDFAISNKCCDHAKKAVAKEALKQNNNDLVVTGVRKAEGGARANAYKSCFSDATSGKAAQFRPLFWFTNADKKEYENARRILNSDCYSVYGMKRTGCAGCPFGKEFEKELEIIKEYEPKLYGAVNKIFGKSYEYTRKYYEYREAKKL